MFQIKLTKWNNLSHDAEEVTMRKNFRTKRDAIAHLRTQGFVQLGELDPSMWKISKLPSILYHDGLSTRAFIYKA